MKKISVALVMAMIAFGYNSANAESPFKAVTGDGECPSGYGLATPQEARADQQNACQVLGTWYIARLAGGGSMDGPGYKCKIRDKDDRNLGHSLCKKEAKPQCFWMENYSGNFKWVPAETIYHRMLTKQECFELDSCDGGLGKSSGGCYKWATSPDAPRIKW